MSFSPSSRGRRLLVWLALALLALAGAAWWWMAGRPVDLPDAPTARIACVSYAPFREPGETPLDPHAFISPGRIDADLRALSERFDCVRTYSQGQGLSAVPGIAARYHMQVLMGIWLGRDVKANAEQVALGIATARRYPQVLRGVIVGNEVLLRGELPSAQIAGYLAEVRAALPAAIPVSYADVWEYWLCHPELAGAVDFVEADGAVVEAAGEDDADDGGSAGFGGGAEEGIDGGAEAVFAGAAGEVDAGVLDEEVLVGRGDVDVAGVERLAVGRV